MDRIPCAVAIPRRGPQVLLLRRRPDDRSFPGGWCFPGGRKDDADIDTAAAALRELFEETGLNCLSFRPFHSGEAPLPRRNRIHVIDAYMVEVHMRDIVLSDEHVEYRWVTPEEGLQLELAGNFTRDLLERLR